ncbi:unnamed protein product [Protopolystoma xenopodis]|uniref:EGF-like domain-containing protein n=1 Tax=Protopolystoma xenopodis TaxID=117903 RepID=A0A3S4ZVZ0_9PLAT|nr:unnamed protein product [Protopolystoma xenopodis]
MFLDLVSRLSVNSSFCHLPTHPPLLPSKTHRIRRSVAANPRSSNYDPRILTVRTLPSSVCSLRPLQTARQRRLPFPSLNPCLMNNGGCEQECQNIGGRARCECRDGYQISHRDPTKCEAHAPAKFEAYLPLDDLAAALLCL